MESILITSDTISLPKEFVAKYRGKKVEFVRTNEGLLLRPMKGSIKKARGFLKGVGFGNEQYASQKAFDKDMEL